MLMNPTERQELPQGEYYIQELIGLKVVHKVQLSVALSCDWQDCCQEDEELVGHVDSVYPGNGAPDILIIEPTQAPKAK